MGVYSDSSYGWLCKFKLQHLNPAVIILYVIMCIYRNLDVFILSSAINSCIIPFLQERVGNFLADFYLVNGLVLESRKRREHLSEEDILRNKAIMESLSKGGNLMEQNFEV